MICDICGSSGIRTIVPARQMSDAVRKGFNPFYNGCIPDAIVRQASAGFPQQWALSAISGDTSYSDWNICDSCMSKLSKYLYKNNSSSINTKKESPKVKAWWKFWK